VGGYLDWGHDRRGLALERPGATALARLIRFGVLASLVAAGFYARQGPKALRLTAQLGQFWLAWAGYAAVFAYLAHPLGEAVMGRLLAVFVMFGYVIMGIWLRSSSFIRIALFATGALVLSGALPAPWDGLVVGWGAGLALVLGGLALRFART